MKTSALKNVVEAYGDAIMGAHAKVQQSRALHQAELLNAYMEAVSSNAPAPFVEMMEDMISARELNEKRKTVLDAAALVHHGGRMERTGLSGGGDDSALLLKGAKREHQLFTDTYQKLTRDRSVYTQELENVYSEAERVMGAEAPYVSMLADMLADRHKFNARKTLHDAQQYTEVQAFVQGELPAKEAKYVLRTRQHKELMASGPDMLQGGAADLQLLHHMERVAGLRA
jgi:hypothetical protein